MYGKNSPSTSPYTRWLVLLSILIIISNIQWILNNKAIYWDEAGHAKTVLQIKDTYTKDLFKNGPSYAIYHFYAITSYVYPPFYYICAQPVALLFPGSDSALRILDTLYYLLLIWMAYFLGTMLYNEKTALLSSFILSTYPIIYGFSRYIMLDLLMTCLLVANVIYLLKSDNFKNRRFSLLYGITFGLGMLSKSLFFTFALPLLIYKFFENYKKDRKQIENTDVRRNLHHSILTAVLISSVWYIPNIATFINHSLNIGSHDLFGLGPVYSLKSLLFYPMVLINHQASFFYAILLLLALLLCKRDGNYWFIATGILTPLAIHTILSHKVAHQTIGILPFAALLSAYFITTRKKTLALALTTAVIIVGATQYINLTFGLNIIQETTLGEIQGYPISVWRNQYYYTTHPPQNEDWEIEKILDDIDRLNPNAVNILVLTKKDNFNWLTFSYMDYKRGRDRKLNGEDIIDSMESFMNGDIDPNKNEFIILDSDTYDKTKDTILGGYQLRNYYPLPDGSMQILLEKPGNDAKPLLPP